MKRKSLIHWVGACSIGLCVAALLAGQSLVARANAGYDHATASPARQVLTVVAVPMKRQVQTATAVPVTRQVQTVAALPVTRTVYMPITAMPRPVTLHGAEMNPVSDNAGLIQMAAAEASWTRIAMLWWPDVEPVKGQYNWAAMKNFEDQFVAAAQRHIQPIVIVRGTPDWAQKYSGYPCGPIRQNELSAFGDFVFQLVIRYSPSPYNVKYWELMNEPDAPLSNGDLSRYFGCWGDPADSYYGGGYYAEMLKVVYPRIKQADPFAQVLLGGLLLGCDPRNPPAGDTCTPARFLEGILRAGGAPYFDGISFHAYDYYGELNVYSNPSWNSQSQTTGPAITAKASFLRSVLTAASVTGKYLMNTESAVLCVPAWGQVCDANWEWTKAYYLAQTYPVALSLGLKANLWFSVLGWRNSQLLNSDLTPLPAYNAFVASRRQLENATFDRKLAPADWGGAQNVMGYSFRRGDRLLWVVWAGDAAERALTFAQTPLSIKDVFGNNLPVAGSSLTLSYPGKLFAYIEFALLP